MQFDKSIIGPLVGPRSALLKNHPAVNRDVGLNDQVFEGHCISMGVDRSVINGDRQFQTGVQFDPSVTPELDFSDLLYGSPGQSNDGPMNKENQPSSPSSDDMDLDFMGF